jgi:hypothetical protein
MAYECGNCGHSHRTLDGKKCLSQTRPLYGGDVSVCQCTDYIAAVHDYAEDPDRAWDDYKAGHTDIDGNVLEPLVDEPEQ